MKPIRLYPLWIAAAFGCSMLSTKAQSISHDVVGTAGNDMLTPNMTFSYTIGEPCVSNWLSQSPWVTEGFQQSDVMITSVTETAFTTQLKVYPNPFGSSFTVSFDKISIKPFLQVTHMLGKNIDIKKQHHSSNTITVDMQNMAAGVYLLNVLSDNMIVAVYRVVKSNP